MQDFKSRTTKLGYLATSFIVDKKYDVKGVPIITVSYKNNQYKSGETFKLSGVPSKFMRFHAEIVIDLSCAELRTFMQLRDEESCAYESNLIWETEANNNRLVKTKTVLSRRSLAVLQFPFLVTKRFLKSIHLYPQVSLIRKVA